MKTLLAIGLLVAASLSPTLVTGQTMPPTASAASAITGEVLEVKDVDSYTYLRLKTKDGETWAAVSTAAVKVGSKVTITNPMVMFMTAGIRRSIAGASSTAPTIQPMW